MNIIQLQQTCEAYPEQYWALKGSHIIGYIRLRWGHLTCDYLSKEGQLSDDDIRVYEHTFNDRKDDEYKGCFDTEDERKYHLSKCKDALLAEYNKVKKTRFNKKIK